MNQRLSALLNLSRWAAAFLVVIGHIRHLILVEFNQVEHRTLFVKAVYFFTGFGHEGVIIFFVISGFLVGGVTLERWRSDGPDMAGYAAARISRIYTVLVPALLIGIALDFSGLNWFNLSALYTHPGKYNTVSLTDGADKALDLGTFLGNLFMLQGILTSRLGSNAPLWSLSYEWWYYCIFALLSAAGTGTGAGKLRVVLGVAGLFLAALMPGNLLLLGTIWLLGVATKIWMNSRYWRPPAVVGFIVFLAGMALSRLSHNADNVLDREPPLISYLRDLGLGLTYAAALASVSRLTWDVPLSRWHMKLADFSYSTYLLHFPFMLFLTALGFQALGLPFRLQPKPFGLVYCAAIALLVYVYCYAMAQVTERYTGAVRGRLNALFGARDRRALRTGSTS